MLYLIPPTIKTRLAENALYIKQLTRYAAGVTPHEMVWSRYLTHYYRINSYSETSKRSTRTHTTFGGQLVPLSITVTKTR